jgi:hypothetical protein
MQSNQEGFSPDDEAELDQLYCKKYSGLLKLSEDDILSISALESRKFGNYGRERHVTPVRQDTHTSSFSSTIASGFTTGSSGSGSSSASSVSKSSIGLAKVLQENRMYRNRFAETRIVDVEQEIFTMNAEFHSAAEYHAPFLLFMKSYNLIFSVFGLLIFCFNRATAQESGRCSEADAFEVKKYITDMTSNQTKEKDQPMTRAYTTRREWLAFLKEVSKFHFNPLMPNKSGIF